MLTVTLSFTLATLFSASAFAEFICKWTAQGTDTNFATDQIYSAKPKLEKQGCAGPDSAPACTGYIYCSDKAAAATLPPHVLPVACKGVKAEGKWRCPDAKTCYDDPDVQIAALPKTPSKIGGVPAGSTGSGGVVREGAGGL